MGGMDGFGPVEHGAADESTQFHSDWEARAFALVNTVLGRTGANVPTNSATRSSGYLRRVILPPDITNDGCMRRRRC